MVSPYLLRPVRELKEVLSSAGALASETVLPFTPRGVSGTAAAILRQQGRVFRPRVVWINDTDQPGVNLREPGVGLRKPSVKPRKKD